MNREDVIRLLRETNINLAGHPMNPLNVYVSDFEHFANLVIEECLAARDIEIEALRAQRDELAKNAERYLWLRDVGDATWRPFALREGYSAQALDEAIDTAILKTLHFLRG